MVSLLQFELSNYFKKVGIYIFLLLALFLGFAMGYKFTLGFGADIFRNSPYAVSYMTGFLTLFCIFFTSIFGAQILFREKESGFNLILYATPIRKTDYLMSRLIAIVIINLLCFTLIIIGLFVGHQFNIGKEYFGESHISSYILPLFIFGIINSIFCTAVISAAAWISNNKMIVYVAGVFIYIMYMVMLVYSNSPMMAHGMPQSELAAKLSAILDPFGLSAFFAQTKNWSVAQRNSTIVVPTGILLINRIGVLVFSLAVTAIAFRKFSFQLSEKKKKSTTADLETVSLTERFIVVQPGRKWNTHLQIFFSFLKIQFQQIIRSKPFILTTIGLIFFVAMEINEHIEGGIRFPQRYASSGLMANRIIGSFYGICVIVILYYAHLLVWSSRDTRINILEDASPASRTVIFFSRWFTLNLVIIIFTTLMVSIGLTFQITYGYLVIDFNAYAGIYLFTTLPLIITAGLVIWIQNLINHRLAGLALSSAVVFLLTSSMGEKILSHPLLNSIRAYEGLYSDMNGYGPYANYAGWQFLFGVSVVLFLTLVLTRQRKFRWIALLFLVPSVIAAINLTKGNESKSKEQQLALQADYEIKYRKFSGLPQPVVAEIKTTIDLYPETNSYLVNTEYLVQNQSAQPINEILINLDESINIQQASILDGNQWKNISKTTGIIALKKSLHHGDSIRLRYQFTFRWKPVNGHAWFNAIIENGSFMRISNYYPKFGYQSENEITDKDKRKEFKLGEATALTSIDAKKDSITGFTKLDMVVSTSGAQTAIGVGELVREWKKNGRNYFHYIAPAPIPFRFAVSSAQYAKKFSSYRGRKIEIYYHPSHWENVDRLEKNIYQTLDYCESQFGAYKYSTIRFAEVSAFTRGFAATAYPASVFMTEDMVFHTNVETESKQDLINELAGHELAHAWWGNDMTAPHYREGATMMTETLAMYTELMLVRKMYGYKKSLENVRLHLGIYLDERGFTKETPLFKVSPTDRVVGYSKGLVVMHQLESMIGEEKLNIALKNFLKNNTWPNPRPVSTDLLRELYAITDSSQHNRIDDLFKKITLYRFTVNNTSVKPVGNTFELVINSSALKDYEDGLGHSAPAPFIDSVEIAIQLKNGKKIIRSLPIINNKISGNIHLQEKPESIMIDPNIRFIQTGEKGWIKLQD